MTQIKDQTYHILRREYLHDYEISKFLSTSELKWIDPEDFDSSKYSSNSSIFCVLEIYLEHPKVLRQLRNDYPLTLLVLTGTIMPYPL